MKKEQKVYLRFIDGEYYGDSFEWDILDKDISFEYPYVDFPQLDSKDGRLYTIEAIKRHLDELSEFIRPSVLLDFIKTISDTNTGEELYNNLQENVKYVLDLYYKIVHSAEPIQATKFNDFVFGVHVPYGNENECHLCLFGKSELLMLWLKPHDVFVIEFKSRLKGNQELYLLAYDDASLKEATIVNLKERIKNWKRERDRIEENIALDEKRLAQLTNQESKDKAILMSIKPQYVAKILNKEKTIEIRKRFPKDYVGWVYIYCTKDKKYANLINRGGFLTGMVCARFWCDKVEEITFYPKKPFDRYGTPYRATYDLLTESCLEYDELDNYLNKNNGYAIHITKLEIFDKPKELNSFVSKIIVNKEEGITTKLYMQKPFQSWGYIWIE